MKITRRDLVRSAALGAAVAPLIIPSRAWGANSRIRVGQIGCGRIAQGHDMPGVIKSDLADYVAICELDAKRLADGVAIIEKSYAERGVQAPKIRTFDNYRELVARKDIDAVVISTPDHWHAEVALAAIEAGKDVYLQKPFTMTHAEGVILRDAVKRHGRILQVGSQQRSWEQFRRAAELIRSGRIGHVQRVEIGLPIDPTAPDAPPMAIPQNLDFGQWLGPTPFKYYTEMRVHPQADYSRPGWLRHEAHCLGMITGWGSHHYDTMHWALQFENTGPSRVEGKGDFPDPERIWNVHGSYDVPFGSRIFGSLASSGGSDPKILDPNGLSHPLPVSKSHHKNWLESVHSRKQPLAPAHIAHRSNSACIVSWIAMKLGRPLEWDPKTERFKNDDEANAMLTRGERDPYGALKLAKA